VEKHKNIMWVDIFKGILIILMVIGHTWSPWTPYIYLFHMPAFIFISGYTANISKYRTMDYIKKKVLVLLLPFFIINIIYILICKVLQVLNMYHYFYNDQFNYVLKLNFLFKQASTVDLGGATWFLIVLFFVEVIYKILYEILKKVKIDKYISFICLLIFFISLYLIRKHNYLPYNLDLGLYGILYFEIGRIFRKYYIFEKEIDKKTMLIFSIIIIAFFGKFYHPKMNWPTRDFDSFFVNILTSICGIYLTYITANLCLKIKLFVKAFSEIGRKTFSILILQFFVFRVTFIIMFLFGIVDISYLKELVPRAGNNFWCILTVTTVIICFGIGKISENNYITNYIINARLKVREK